MDDAIATKLEQRLGRLHAKQRLEIKKDHEAQILGQGRELVLNSFAYPKCAQTKWDFLAGSEECRTCTAPAQLYSAYCGYLVRLGL
jgi:hypothetical protein